MLKHLRPSALSARLKAAHPAVLGAVGALLLIIGMGIGTFSFYGYRVYTELRPGSWRAPTAVIDRNGRTLVALYGSDWKIAEPVVLKELPAYVPNAFLAAEDARFRSHIGIDPVGIGRAVLSNARAGGVTEGGSTITQQLAKNRFNLPNNPAVGGRPVRLNRQMAKRNAITGRVRLRPARSLCICSGFCGVDRGVPG